MSGGQLSAVERWLKRRRKCPYVVDTSGRWAKWCGKRSKPGHPRGHCKQHAAVNGR